MAIVSNLFMWSHVVSTIFSTPDHVCTLDTYFRWYTFYGNFKLVMEEMNQRTKNEKMWKTENKLSFALHKIVCLKKAFNDNELMGVWNPWRFYMFAEICSLLWVELSLEPVVAKSAVPFLDDVQSIGVA